MLVALPLWDARLLGVTVMGMMVVKPLASVRVTDVSVRVTLAEGTLDADADED